MARLTGEKAREIFERIAASEGMTPEQLVAKLGRACVDPANRFEYADWFKSREQLSQGVRDHIDVCDVCREIFHTLGPIRNSGGSDEKKEG